MRASIISVLAGALSFTNAIELDLNSKDSILNASKTVVEQILEFYPTAGSPPHVVSPNVPGLLRAPYYFWNSGLALTSLLNYWSASGDESIAPFIREGLLFQVGSEENFMPANQTKSEGNDDQAFWGLAAMTAAEEGFPISENGTSGMLSWLDLAKNVFDSQVPRWDDSSCGGGLRWQIFTFNTGYDYKNSISNGLFAELAARLYRFTGNSTYADWAQKSVEWSRSVTLIQPDFQIYDGTQTRDNCTSLNRTPWSYDAGVYLKVAAYISNVTASDSKYWTSFARGIFNASAQQFTDNQTHIIYEAVCEPQSICDLDQQSYKSVFAQGLAVSSELLTGEEFEPMRKDIAIILKASAKAAAEFPGGCGFAWREGEDKRLGGVGGCLDTLEVFLANLPARTIGRGNDSVASAEMPPTASGNGTGGGNQNGTTGADEPQETGAASGFVASSVLVLGGMVAAVLL